MKLIVASNRLPITITRNADGFRYQKTSGGLVTGIESLAEHMEFIWIGNISGMSLTEDNRSAITKDCWEQFKSVPVFIDAELNDRCYNGFCNAILWPTLHSFPDDVCFTYPEYDAYREYNSKIADKILETCGDGDIVWVHDYHLMLVPELLKCKNSTLKVMFFLHTAFPDISNMEPLIVKRDIFNGICASDVISFHLPEYAQNFKEAIEALNIETKGKINAVAIGIDPKMFRDTLEDRETRERMEEFKKRFEGKKVILGVDRTDYIKGLPHKMKGFQRYLERNPEMKGKTVLLQIAVPSRLEVKEYETYVGKINEIVTDTNGEIGDILSTPIHFQFGSISFKELCAIYAISDMILITSIMDGMNLVALEYVACQDEKKGIVVLSKYAGAMSTLQGSINFNPNNTEEIAESIEMGMGLDEGERERRHLQNRNNIDIFTSVRWAEDNLKHVKKDWKKDIGVKDE